MRYLPFDYATRNLGRSLPRLALAISGSTLVVLLVIASAGFIRGMSQSLTIAGVADNVIFLGSGSEESVERSEISTRAAEVVATLPGVRERLGERFVSPEVHLALAIRTDPNSDEGRLTPVRGVRSAAYLVHPQVYVTAGRTPTPGRQEVMVGGLVSGQLGVNAARLVPGNDLFIDGEAWKIVGNFRAPQTVMDSEIWMPLTDLQVISQRENLSCVILTLDPARGGDFADAEILAAQRLDLELSAMRESAYYQTLEKFYAPIRAMVLVTAALIALGGILGGLNTMVAAFASRIREVGTLQVLGYPRRAIILSFIQESVIVTTAGALIAGTLGVLVLDGIAVRFSMGAFGLIVDAPVLLIGVGAGIVLGVIGSMPPTLRCLRLPVGQALRA